MINFTCWCLKPCQIILRGMIFTTPQWSRKAKKKKKGWLSLVDHTIGRDTCRQPQSAPEGLGNRAGGPPTALLLAPKCDARLNRSLAKNVPESIGLLRSADAMWRDRVLGAFGQ